MENIKIRYYVEIDTRKGKEIVKTDYTLNELEKMIITHKKSIEIARVQYTGLKDKNGVEIYGGDILKWLDTTLVIVWRDDNSEFSAINRNRDGKSNVYYNFRKDMANNRCEIIGNIYENKELLEEKQQNNKRR